MTEELQNRQRRIKLAAKIFLAQLAMILGTFFVVWMAQSRDLGLLFLVVCFSMLAVPSAIWVIKGTSANLRRARLIRYTLAEFILLVLLTGLVMGLTAKALPENFGDADATVVSLGVGVLLLCGGLLGLWIANQLSAESPRQRIFFILRGFLTAPAVIGFFAWMPAVEHITTLDIPLRLPLAVGLVAGGVTCMMYLLAVGQLFIRARAAEKAARKAEKSAAAPEKPPEKPPSEKPPDAEAPEA